MITNGSQIQLDQTDLNIGEKLPGTLMMKFEQNFIIAQFSLAYKQ